MGRSACPLTYLSIYPRVLRNGHLYGTKIYEVVNRVRVGDRFYATTGLPLDSRGLF